MKAIEVVQHYHHKAVRVILNLKGICSSITEGLEKLELPTLENCRASSRKSTLMKFLENSDKHQSLLIDLYNKLCISDECAHTLSAVKGLPKAVTANTDIFYNSIITPRTTMRDLGIQS